MPAVPLRLARPVAIVTLTALAACAAVPAPAPTPAGYDGGDAIAVRSLRAAAPQEPQAAGATNEQEELAKKLANPVASLISVPFQLNYDHDIGSNDDGERWTMNIQPVVPIELNEDWNLISRTIVPLVHVEDGSGPGSETGLGDILQSAFFSPKEPTAGGWIWGAGPALLLPTATDDLLGADKLALGPTGVALRQQGPWTYGGLANHLWTLAGDDDRPDVNATFLQPFVNYTTPEAWSYILNCEATFDWHTDEWSIPVHAMVSKVLRFGEQTVSIGGGLRYWAESPDGGPEGLGFRFVFTLLF